MSLGSGSGLFAVYFFFFFKQKTAYEMRISDWSSDVCSSDLLEVAVDALRRTSDSVAHELRTPLARLRSHLEEMAESESHSPASIARALDEVERLATMFETVLKVPQLEQGSRAIQLHEVEYGSAENRVGKEVVDKDRKQG